MENVGFKKVAMVPFFPKLGNIKTNIDEMEKIVSEILSNETVELVIFPEMAGTGYLLENLTSENARSYDNEIFGGLLKLSGKTDILFGNLEGSISDKGINLIEELLIQNRSPPLSRGPSSKT